MALVCKILENDLLRSKLGFWRTAFMVVAIVLLGCFYVNVDGSLGGFITGKYIAKVHLDGFISDNDDYVDFLTKLGQDNNISAVVLQINSFGGSLIGSEKVYEAVASISKSKPIVSVIGGSAASGGYMVAAASDYIIARPSSITGSIGVVFQYYGINDLAKKLGVKLKSVKSSVFKASPSPFEDNPQSSFDEMKPLVNAAYKHFVSIVKNKRTNISNSENAFSGKVFLGDEALSLGLIDKLGNNDDALQWLKDKGVNTKNIKTVSFNERRKPKRGLFSTLSSVVFDALGIDEHFYNVSANDGLFVICCVDW